MSLSRAAKPLLVLKPLNSDAPLVRTMELESSERHAHLLSVATQEGQITAVGLFDAPLTHSGDGGDGALMTFGGLRLDLR